MTIDIEILKSMMDELEKRIDDPLPDQRPFIVALSEPLPRETRSKQAGITRKVTFDVDHELYQILQSLPEKVVLKGVLWIGPVEEGTAEAAPTTENGASAGPAPKKSVRRKEPKQGSDQVGKFWQQFYLRVLQMEDVMETLEIDDLQTWNEYLRIRYGQVSLRAVDPQLVIDELEGKGLKAAAAKCRRIIVAEAEAEVSKDSNEEFLSEHRLP